MSDTPLKYNTPKRRARIYRKAAERIAERKNAYSCCAIENAILGHDGNLDHPMVEAWPALVGFKGPFFLQEAIINAYPVHADRYDFRVLLLCFAAAMAETGDI